MTETKRLADFTKEFRLASVAGAKLPRDKQDEWQQKATGYRCKLVRNGKAYSFDYWMGSAHTEPPTVEDVLDNLASDASAGEQTFYDFCSEFGYDHDSRKAEATWKACCRTAKAIRRLLGDEYEAFIYADRN